jgi:nitrate/nitrite transporter NarK
MLALGLASFSNDLAMAPDWAACMDVGGRLAGSLSGSMNMMGNLGGAVSPYVVGALLKRTHGDFSTAFYMSSAVFVVGALCWIFIDPVTSMDDRAPAPRPEAA